VRGDENEAGCSQHVCGLTHESLQRILCES
jgi:hypothetical protein